MPGRRRLRRAREASADDPAHAEGPTGLAGRPSGAAPGPGATPLVGGVAGRRLSGD
ncbi:Hypothetical protein FRAAL4329 [Frankia alni ACN14a]|uniref:Uncharacterized protein n=1 Tax=Frankia alni (strain DSM 45986 / CECT 9034 / ACN14a) TaxID=326424 RepID=Q0RHQ3_FRAAA|nr:Hypothetical protein FRAAL4329 [Frankia alni ACN14a]